MDETTLSRASTTPLGVAGVGAVRRMARWIVSVLPTGDSLPEASWRRRHLAIMVLLWAHVPVLLWVALARGNPLGHALVETAVAVPFAIGASIPLFSKHTREILATIGLASCSGVLTHLSGGLIEMHFHFFIVVAIVTLYQSWLPFGVAIGYVTIHHGLAGALDPASVFNHPAALANPIKWGLIHAGFILAQSAACVIAWRLNETALGGERTARVDLQTANDDLAEAQSLARIGSWDWETVGGDMWWSAELYRILGVDPAEYDPTVEDFHQLIHPDDRFRIEPAVQGAIASRKPFEIEVRIQRPDGEERTVRAIGATPADAAADSTRLVGTVQDITDHRRLEDEIQHRAFHDALTGLPNRALLVERLDHALRRREPRPPMALLFLDLDQFKGVNESLGHDAGDQLLERFSRRLESVIRPSDTAARLGDDEFAVLLELADQAAAFGIAERILAGLRAPFDLDGSEAMVTGSIGVAVADKGSTSGGMLRDADIAMHAAKVAGKNGYRLCTAELRDAASEDLALRRELERVVERGELLLHYQPIVSLETEAIEGVEVLVRWNHPRRGLVPPAEFITLAEETGSIVPIGTWVLQEAARRGRELQDEFGRHLSISVNLSAKQLDRPDVVQLVEATLLDARFDPRDLILEITETAMLSNDDACSHRVQALRRLGIKVALDDFGTGYSSLSYLHRFPVDILKVDRSFVTTSTEGPAEAAFAHAIVQLGATLRLHTVAEGIETSEQRDTLRNLGCESAQGYLFSRPVNFERLRERLREPSDRLLVLP